MTRRQQIHGTIFAVVASMLLGGGWVLASQVGSPPATAATITQTGRTQVVIHTHVLTKLVRGRVIRLKSGERVVRVPLVVIHNLRCHPTKRHPCVRRIVVPAHTIPLRAATSAGATAAIAKPLEAVTVYVPVTITEPAQTITLPAQTVTLPVVTTTETSISVTTITVPITP